MGDRFAIRAENLTKKYMITRRVGTLKEMVVRANFTRRGDTPFKALDDVSFELLEGRSLGIMGHNGSGKSTLLKLISGITVQDSGNLEVNGQVAAMLELGAAFQDEFTGMENIFLQCSIFGMKRPEILAVLSDIIDFSELHRFIHTPVKKYSSGMFMRLAFAIALHLNTRILVFDEILAVGDQAFQTKCRDRIRRAKKEGRTVLFVSHLIEQVETLADDVLWLDHGKVVAFGPAEDILPRYHQSAIACEFPEDSMDEKMRLQTAMPSGRFQRKEARIMGFQLHGENGADGSSFREDEVVTLSVEVEVNEEIPGLRVLYSLGTVDSIRACYNDSKSLMGPVQPGKYRVEAKIQSFGLGPGVYLLTLLLTNPDNYKDAYDYQLRLHALSIKGDRTRIDQGRVLPMGRFCLPEREG